MSWVRTYTSSSSGPQSNLVAAIATCCCFVIVVSDVGSVVAVEVILLCNKRRTKRQFPPHFTGADSHGMNGRNKMPKKPRLWFVPFVLPKQLRLFLHGRFHTVSPVDVPENATCAKLPFGGINSHKLYTQSRSVVKKSQRLTSRLDKGS